MPATNKPIRLSQHVKEQLAFRGTTPDEITAVIQTSKWEAAELNRMQCSKDFTYNQKWNNKFYKTKQVKPIFIEETKEIVVITVYVYYF